MTSVTWENQKRKISSLIPLQNNPRQLTKKQAEDLRDSLEKFDLAEIPAINLNYNILAGHQRLKILQAMGRGEEFIDVRVPSRLLTPEEEMEYCIRSNKNTGEWDFDALANLSEDLLKEVGFDSKEIDKIFDVDTTPEEDDVPSVPKIARTTRGKIYQLGSHRLMCGDSTSKADVALLMDGKIANLMNTDPPYGIDFVNLSQSKGQSKKYEDIENDDLVNGEELQKFLESTITTAFPHLLENCAFYLWHPMLTQSTFFIAAAAAAAGLLINRQIIWVKPSIVFGRGDYHWKHELCFYGWRKGSKPFFYGDRNQSTVWEIGRENNKIHPTQKPVDLFKIPILNHTKQGEICYEPFAGSGSQLIAAEQTGRICYAMEISEAYCDVIIERWCKITMNDPEKIYAQ